LIADLGFPISCSFLFVILVITYDDRVLQLELLSAIPFIFVLQIFQLFEVWSENRLEFFDVGPFDKRIP